MDLYGKAASEFGLAGTWIQEGINRAEERLKEFNRIKAAGDIALEGQDWERAGDEYVAALEVFADDRKTVLLLEKVLEEILPPKGMLLVKSGEFVMGDDGGEEDERPARKMMIKFPFYIDRHEVTNEQYARFVVKTGATPPPHWLERHPPPDRRKHPVVNVTLKDAKAYARWAGENLPTEEQWERAARGTDGQAYPWGDSWKAKGLALSVDSTSVAAADEDTSPAGCIGMVSNVSEWTLTPYDDEYQVVRGGSWAGFEKERKLRPVPSRSAGVEVVGAILLDDPKQPTLSLHSKSEIRFFLVGMAGTRGRATISVQRWLPSMGWISDRFVVEADGEIGRKKRIRLEGGGGFEEVDLRSGCIFQEFVSEDPLAMRWLDPLGASHVSHRAEPPAGVGGGAFLPDFNDKELAFVVRAANRLRADPDARYLNVGFRCVREIVEAPAATN